MAEALGMKRRGYQENESGRTQPNAITVQGLIGLGINANWLLTGEGPMLAAELNDAQQRREDLCRAQAGDEHAINRVEDRFHQIGGDVRVAGEAAKHAAEQGLSAEDVELIRSMAFAYPQDSNLVAALTARLSLDTSAAELAQEFALIPGYSVQVSTGPGAFPGSEEKPSRKLAFRRKWLRYRGLAEKDLVLVFARGDSMEPTISDNNTLMIDTSKTELSDGAIYVIRVNSHLVAKRVQTLTNRDIMLLSDNEAYRPETLTPEQSQDLAVIGKVVWIGKDV